MLFNSLEFAVFLPLVFALYWLLKGAELHFQNLVLLAASYFFYGWWDWRFLSLIVFSSTLDFWIGKKMGREKDDAKRKKLLYLSIFVNLGFLGFFKYFNFFAASFADTFTLLGMPFEASRLNIILPVGISFYTFQTLSYSIDVYRRKLQPTQDTIAFFTFVSFFPQLVAGPIERASNLLPQFFNKRKLTSPQFVDGSRQILIGLFKKIVIADNCALQVNEIFANYQDQSGGTLLLGGIYFAFQIYGDFSGYSDIAIGTARLFGFDLMQNFAFPYFSRDIAEFWRRWHISLSTWFRDYLYIPLGGSRGGTFMKIRNTFAIFLVSGFWHGANWTFIAWGFINACYFLPLLLAKKNRSNLNVVAENSWLPSIRELLQIGITFFLTVIAWIFFRAENMTQALDYLSLLFTGLDASIPSFLSVKIFLNLFVLLVLEWLQRREKHGLMIEKWARPIRWIVYFLLLSTLIREMTRPSELDFIYFQF